jgi:peptidoglycan/LPS O-acetylase OafA/YrhL
LVSFFLSRGMARLPLGAAVAAPVKARLRHGLSNGAVCRRDLAHEATTGTGLMRARTGHCYDGLDALRGVAACAVMLYHFGRFLAPTPLLPSAYLAVDLFFLLSGFVICHAYEARLSAGKSFGRFVLARLVRLYPLYLTGTLLGTFYVVSRLPILHARLDPADPSHAFGLAVLFLPRLTPDAALPGLYPFDLAAWSLLFELVINIAYGGVAGWLTTRRLIVLAGVAAGALVLAAFIYGSLDVGMTARTMPGGGARVLFSFSVGVLLCRHRKCLARWLPRPRHPLMWLLLVALFAVPVPPGGRPAFDLACALAVFPIVICCTAQCEPRRLAPLARQLGRLSYPIYILHTPLLLLWAGGWKAAFHQDPSLAAPWGGLLFAVLTLAFSYALLRLFDEPVRASLTSHLRRPAAQSVAAPPLARPG